MFSRPKKVVTLDNTRMYKLMTEETDMNKINEGTAGTITLNELVYYLAMPDKDKIKDNPVVGNAKRLLKDVLEIFTKNNKLKIAEQIINVLNASNIIIEDLNDKNIDKKIDEILDMPEPVLGGPPKLGLGGLPDPNDATLANQAGFNSARERAKLIRLIENYRKIRIELVELNTKFNDLLDNLIFITNFENNDKATQTYKDMVDALAKLNKPVYNTSDYPDTTIYNSIKLAIKEIVEANLNQFNLELIEKNFNSQISSINSKIAESAKNWSDINDILEKNKDYPNFNIIFSKTINFAFVQKRIRADIINDEKITKTIETEITDLNTIKENYIDIIPIYFCITLTDLKYVQLPMTKKYKSKYEDYDNKINNLLKMYLNLSVVKTNTYMSQHNLVKYKLYEKYNKSFERKFFDIAYKILGYKNIIDNYNKNVQAEYAQDKKIGTRKILCGSIINYILNFLGPDYENNINCFDFAKLHFEDDDKKWFKTTLTNENMEIVFKKNPLPMRETEISKEAAINSATAKAIHEIAQPSVGDGEKFHFVEKVPYTSLKAEDSYKLNPITLTDESSQSETIKYLFVALSNYPTHMPNEFAKLKWPFNRLIPMIQEITAELKRAGRTTDGPKDVPDGKEGLGTLITFPMQNTRVYKGGAKHL